MIPFDQVFKEQNIILTEGSIIERLKREFNYPLHADLLNAAMLYEPEGRKILTAVYNDYISTAAKAGLPVIILTPTWRANKINAAPPLLAGKNINLDAFLFLDEIRNKFEGQTRGIYIGGLMGVKGDSYKPSEAMESIDAYEFHKWQADQLASAGVDFLILSTAPSLKEAAGIARAMAEQTIPYIISFVIRPDGTLLDGTPLDRAITSLDSVISPPPLSYMINCVHPSNLFKALERLNLPEPLLARLNGIQGNASDKSPEELDNADTLHADDAGNWGSEMAKLNSVYKLKILGGCCGTGIEHIQCLTRYLVEPGG